MNRNPHETAHRLLAAAAAFTILFGLVMAVGAVPALSGPLAWSIDGVFWPLDGAQGMDDPASRLLTAILGGIMTGFGAMVWVATRELADRPAALRRLVGTGLAVWFVVDSTGSVLSGGALNVLLNVGFLALFVPSLVMLGQDHARQAT